MIRAIRSAIEEKWEVQVDVTHSVWPLTEKAGRHRTRFEIGRDSKMVYERLRRKSAKVQGLSFAKGITGKRRRSGGLLGKFTCMWEDGVKANTGEVIVVNLNGVLLPRPVRRKSARERWERSNLEIVVEVPWRTNEDDAKMDGVHLKGEVVMMHKDYKEKMEMEEHGPVPKRVRVHSEMSRVHVVAQGDGETSAYRKTAKHGLKRS